MKNQKLLQRLVECLAANEGIQPTRAEIRRRLESLSPREVDVLCCVLGGQLNREIAPQLGITERTVKAHRGRTMKKLGVRSTAELLPMVSRFIAYPAWPKFRRRRKESRSDGPIRPGANPTGAKKRKPPARR
jgi:FixJ family two-component response regulator